MKYTVLFICSSNLYNQTVISENVEAKNIVQAIEIADQIIGCGLLEMGHTDVHIEPICANRIGKY